MVPRHEILDRLRNVRLFSNLSPTDLEALAALVRPIEYTQGAIVYRQGEPGDRYFIVHRGRLRATRLDPEGERTEVRRLGPGDGVGETSLLLGDVRDATLEAVERSTLLYIEREAFEQFLREHPRAERALRMRPDVAERRRYPRFAWMETDEFPVKVIHKHVALLLINLIPPALLLGVMTPAIGFGVAKVVTVSGNTFLGLALLVIAVLLAATAFVIALMRYVDWRNDIYVVTNRRVAHRERTGFLGLGKESLSAAPLHAIQDINVTHIGALASIFDFGDLSIETAGGGGKVEFLGIPRPAEIQQAILQQQARALALARLQQREQIRQTIYRHLAREAEKPSPPQPSEPAEERPTRTRRWGCLLLPLGVVRYFFPPLWERAGETVTWHKHRIELLRTAGAPLVGMFTAALIFLSGILIRDNWLWVALPSSFIIFLMVFPWFLWKFEDWRNDYYQVTGSRIIHVERKPFYTRYERREASLEAVTNVRAQQTFWGRIFRYGDVIVETRAPEGTFHFQAVSRPRAVQQEIFAHVAAFNRRRQQQEAERRRTEMVDWFMVYDELRRSQPSQESK